MSESETRGFNPTPEQMQFILKIFQDGFLDWFVPGLWAKVDTIAVEDHPEIDLADLEEEAKQKVFIKALLSLNLDMAEDFRAELDRHNINSVYFFHWMFENYMTSLHRVAAQQDNNPDQNS